MHELLVLAWKCSNVYLFWIGIHYLSAHIYPYFCADLSIYGVLSSPFLVIAPHCKAFHWLQQTSTAAIQNMWVILGTWLAEKLVPNPAILTSVTTSHLPTNADKSP